MDRPRRILVVDDEAPNRELLEAMLIALGHEVELAKDGFEALAMLRLGFDLVLLDLMMPGMDGFEVAQRIRREAEDPDVPIIVVTSLSGREERLRAVEAGANDFIAKPVDSVELRLRAASLLKMKESQDLLRHERAELEQTVQRRTAELRKALQEMSDAQRRTYQAELDTIERLALAAELRDWHTGAHIRRISRFCDLLARELKLPPKEREIVRYASPMHDVGKLAIADRILLKPGRLRPDEWETVKQHSTIGGKILRGSSSELLKAGGVFAVHHHEKWDGSGYPKGLAGEDIPVWARICAISDVFDSLTHKRPYKDAFANDRALEIMLAGRGAHFEPAILDLFLKNLDEVVAIQEEQEEE